MEYIVVVLGLASAASWGAGDFCGGLAARRLSAYSVVIGSQSVGFVLLIGLALAFGEPLPTVFELGWGALAGVVGTLGLVALYRSLASGRMGVAAPVSAVVTAIVPVVVGGLIEGVPGQWQFTGFGLALAAVWFLARSEEAAFRWRDLGLPFVAGLGFGFFLVTIDRVSEAAVFWPLVAARLASVSLLGALMAAMQRLRAPGRDTLWAVALAGMFDAGGNALFGLAARAGRLDVAGVLSSLYPASTVWLAWLVLRERITRLQVVGIVAALAAIVLIAG